MHITLDLPESVVSLLGEAPERTIYRLIKAHLAPPADTHKPRGRPIHNAQRDAAIADKAVAGVRHNIIAKEYGLSIIRVSQIVAQGKADAYARQQEATTAKIRNLFDHT